MCQTFVLDFHLQNSTFWN